MVEVPEAGQPIHAGLCASCAHVQRVSNQRGSLFYLCQAARWNPDLPKYPRLPVFRCPEYTPDGSPPASEADPP